MVDIQDFDFVDFGSSHGGSMKLAIDRLGGTRGLGIDIRPQKVESAIEAGHDVMQGDVTDLDLPDQCVRFAVLSHVLEHLESPEAVRRAIAEAVRISTDFVYLCGPFYDADPYLEQHGLRPYWSHWKGHRCHVTTGLVAEALRGHEIVMGGLPPILSSRSPVMHSLGSPMDQHAFDPTLHPPKPTMLFTQPVFRELVCFVKLRDFDTWPDVTRSRGRIYPLERLGFYPTLATEVVKRPRNLSRMLMGG